MGKSIFGTYKNLIVKQPTTHVCGAPRDTIKHQIAVRCALIFLLGTFNVFRYVPRRTSLALLVDADTGADRRVSTESAGLQLLRFVGRSVNLCQRQRTTLVH